MIFIYFTRLESSKTDNISFCQNFHQFEFYTGFQGCQFLNHRVAQCCQAWAEHPCTSFLTSWNLEPIEASKHWAIHQRLGTLIDSFRSDEQGTYLNQLISHGFSDLSLKSSREFLTKSNAPYRRRSWHCFHYLFLAVKMNYFGELE
jgi:hypothetical protein